jgi:hypothetical protein
LPNTLKLQEGVTIESGTLAQASHIVLTADDVIASQTLDLTAQGRNNNRPVQLSPIHLETSVTATPTGREMPSLSGLKLALTSAFATISGGGESLAAVKVKGNFDLDKLRNEAAQFADLGEVKLAGTGDFEVTTSGDPTNQAEPIAASAKLNLNNVTVAGVGTKPVQQERLAVVASGKLLREQNVLQDGSLAVTSGDPRSPLLDLNATASVNLNDNSLPQFALAKLNVTDLRRVQDQFGAFVPALAENRIRIDGGALSATVAGSYAGDTLTMTQPLSATVSNLTVSRDGKPVLSRETIATNVNGTVSTKDGISGNLTDLSVTSQSNLVSLKKAGNGPLVFSMGPDGTPRGNGAIALAADLKRLNDLAQAFGGQVVAEGQPQLKSGLFNGTVTLAKADQPQTSIDFNGELTQVTVSSAAQGNALENEKVTITLKASVPDDLKGTTPVTADGQINSTFAETKLSNVRLLPGAGTWDMVQSATVNARIPDLPKLYALLNALAPPEAQPQVSVAPRPREEAPVVAVSFMQVRGDEPISRPRPQDRQQQQRPQPQPQPAPAPAAAEPEEPQEPLEITSGGATLALDVKRDPAKKTTSINVTDARVSQLGLRRGNRQYRFDREQPISFKLAAEVNAAVAPDRTLVQQIQSLNVTQLAGDLRVATLAMPQPITVTNLAADTPTAKGGVRVEGELKNLTPLLSVLQGSNPLPYEGAYVVTQNVATEGNSITLDGEIAASGFRVLDPQNANQPVFTEDKLTVRNGITANPKDKVAQIRALNVDMASSGAVKLGVTGYVENWNGQVNGAPVLASVRELVADVSYDLEKLWPVVKPFVATPEDPEDPMNEVTVVGKHQKKFVVNGPYYTGETHEALREIQVVGDLTIDRFVYPGAELQNVQLPIYLRKGVAQVEYAGKSGRERMPPPAAFNGGTMSLGGIRVDLTRPDPRVTIPDKYKLVSGASINPLLGQTLGKYVNPIFPNSQQAKGLLDVQINYCRNVALGEKLTSADSGEAQVTFSLSDMDIANPTGSLMFGAIPGVSFGEGQADTFRGQIKEAVVTLANGVITEDVTLLLVDAGKAPADVIGSRQPVEPTPMPMRFQGTVRLEDLRQNINVSLPTGLLGRFFRSDKDREIFAKVFPEGVPMTLTGTTVKPKVDPGNIAQKILEGQVKGLIDPSKEGGAGSLLEDLLNRDRDRNKDRDPDRRNR